MTLIAVTLLSLFLAIAMGVVTWRLVQEERQRSAARLAALAAELGGEGWSASDDPDPLAPRSANELPDRSAGDGGAARESEAGIGGLFSSPVPPTPAGWGRLAALAGAAGLVLAVVATVFLSGSGAGDAAESLDDARPPLDLIALRHAAEGPFLDISGSVRNPPAAAGAARLSVVAMAFDEAGTLVATRRTPVETPSLPPGADSPFTIRLLAAGISRYRISFLLDETTIPHIDRRSGVQPPVPVGDAS
ncbi:MAG: hypothetical protein F4X11_16620 [Acidobacteria bacterium]|nr:hypothetical protein [Acidobacteriota bacterium]